MPNFTIGVLFVSVRPSLRYIQVFMWPPEILPLMPIFLSPIRTTFSEFAAKHSKDPRFKAIEKMKDREAMFTEIMTALRKKDKEESKNKVEKVCHRLPTTILKCPLESTGC